MGYSVSLFTYIEDSLTIVLLLYRFRWERVSTILGFSDVDIIWNIPENTEPGSYRIRHFGNYRYILGGVYPYDGTTRIFEVSK